MISTNDVTLQGQVQPWKADFGYYTEPRINFQGLLNRPRIHNTHVHSKPPRPIVRDWTTKQGFPKVEVAAHMIKFVDGFFGSKPDEQDSSWNDKALAHGHIPTVFVNLPRRAVENGPAFPGGFPPGFGMAEIGGGSHMFDMPIYGPHP
jgi:hypothetical protein